MHGGYVFFKTFKTRQSVSYERDARLRLGDSHFVLKAYWPAMDQYEKVRKLLLPNAAYAMYQQATSYGFVNRPSQKLNCSKNSLYNFPIQHWWTIVSSS